MQAGRRAPSVAAHGTPEPQLAAAPTIRAMVSWRGRGRAALLAAAVGVGGCADATPPAITAPPAPADAVAWPEVTWGGTVIDRPPEGFTSERLIAVTGSELGFVAVGVAEAVGLERGQAWFSADGIEWERTGPENVLDGVSLIDVAAGPGGFFALGDDIAAGRPADRPGPVLLRSPDGRTWERLPGVPGVPPGYASAIGGGPKGYVAVGYTDPDPGAILMVSADGVAWRLIDPATAGDISDGIGAPIAVDGGWLAVGSPGGALVVLRSMDGSTWEATAVEGPDTNGTHLSRVLEGPHGLMATGGASDGCGPFASCPGQAVGWWSQDGVAWGRIVGMDPAIAEGALTVHPERGFVAVTGREAWSSPDGWSWTSLGEIADGQSAAVDVAVWGDRIVVVGDLYEPDGSTRALFWVGGPDIEVLD